jgi:hypothetical protein
VGVVGAAVFLEKPVAPPAAPPIAAAQLADGRTAAAPRATLGTAHGQREWSVSAKTQFDRLSSSPQAQLELHYDSHVNLVAAGVIPEPITQARAFPGERLRGYVPDPPGR